MISASMLPGDSLFAWHYPQVLVPTQDLFRVTKRSARLRSAGLTRAVSLPEQDRLNREHSASSRQRHLSCSYSSLVEDRTEEERGSDTSDRNDSSSSPEEETRTTSSCMISCGSGTTRGQWSHNSFLPSSNLEEEDEDSDGDNLNGYHEDSLFMLHGNPQFALNTRDANRSCVWDNVVAPLDAGSEECWLSNRHRCGSAVTPMALREEHCDAPKDSSSYSNHCQLKCSPELFSSSHADCTSDSSCTSSDGVLVNFCSIYDRSNKPAIPHDLCSPRPESPLSPEGSVFLNLQPVPHTYYRQADTLSSTTYWSPQGVDSNCNLCSPSHNLSPLQFSDLTFPLASQSTLPVRTNQKYYKLVTCDLSSKSPSPACPSLANYPEDLCRCNPSLSDPHPMCERKEGQEMEIKQVSPTFTEKSQCRIAQTYCTQTLCHTEDSQNSKNQGTNAVLTGPNNILNQEHCTSQVGVSRETPGTPGSPVLRLSKAQRPTSLPITPFVLMSADKPQAQSQHFGFLLEKYMTHKSTKSSSSQLDLKLDGKGGKCQSRPSAMGGLHPVFQEAPSSSDTCSTCTPSPACFSHPEWMTQTGLDLATISCKPAFVQGQDKTGMSQGLTDRMTTCVPSQNQTSPVKVPACEDIIALTPESTHAKTAAKTPSLTPPKTHVTPCPSRPTLTSHVSSYRLHLLDSLSSQERKFQQRGGGAPAASSGFSLSPPKDALQPPRRKRNESLVLTKFCLTPGTTSRTTSVSHLQKRGLLRAASRAVDLILAHFDKTRDPNEKMRLGSSSQSPTICGLVLEHLCPAIQNILEDGLRDHMPDLLVGKRSNDSWIVVEASTRAGPSTRVIHSLVSKIRQCPQLSSQSMRLRGFIMGLLNLRCLEYWLSHLQGQKDTLMVHYHPWGFLLLSSEQSQPLFEELLLLLQPLSALPFDLNLLLEPRLVELGHLFAEKHGVCPTPPCSAFLITSWPLLQSNRQADKSTAETSRDRHLKHSLMSKNSSILRHKFGEVYETEGRSLSSKSWHANPAHVHAGVKMGDQSQNTAKVSCKVYTEQEEKRGDEEEVMPHMSSSHFQDLSGLYWARLFGGTSDAISCGTERESCTAQKKRCVRPSQWLSLDRAQLGLLLQSLKSMKFGGSSQ